MKLNRMIVLFDDNGITIDGKLSLSDSVDQVKRFEIRRLVRDASMVTIRKRSPRPSRARRIRIVPR